MDVVRLGLFFILAGTVMACSVKTPETVFPAKQTTSCPEQVIHNQFLVRWEDGHLSQELGSNREDFLENFIAPQLEKIRYVEFNTKISSLETNSIHLSAVPLMDTNTWGPTIIEAPAVWAQGYQGQGVLVGVVDSAVDYYHPQIFPRLAVNTAEMNGRTGVDDDGNGLVDDKYGWDFAKNRAEPTPADHGTHVAGIIAADHSAGVVRGVAPLANIIPANFMANDGGSVGAAIAAMNYVVSRGARIINASWGGNLCSQQLGIEIAGLSAKNVLFVSAAGNNGQELDYSPEWPAFFDLAPQLTIAASRNTDRIAAWSNTSWKLVHLAAPGDDILSSVPGGYAFMQGTSMAAPFVSGAAALLWNVRPQANVIQIKQALMNSVDIPVETMRVKTGGRLNVRKAVEEIKRLVP